MWKLSRVSERKGRDGEKRDDIAAESESYARLGSELERRIYSIGEKDVRNVYCTFLAKRRKEDRGGLSDESEWNGERRDGMRDND